MNRPDLFLLAGEASGDLHGSNLLAALQKHAPGLKVTGVGGPLMRERGMPVLLPMEEFQVMGFSDVILSLPKLIKHFFKIRKFILEHQPKAVVFIDYPGFNLRLARSLRKMGFENRLIHYIAPTVWAWGKGRIETMAKNLDLLLTIFPFEAASFEKTSLPVQYVGNPLIASLKAHEYQPGWRDFCGLKKESEIVAVFPGSRVGEIKRNFPLHLRAMSDLKKDFPNLQFAVSCNSKELQPLIHHLAQEHEFTSFLLVDKNFSYELMREAKAAIAKSGTVTLELALHGCPAVVTYETSCFNYFIAKHIIKINLPHYCICNILLKETLFPEMIGIDLDPKELTDTMRSILRKSSLAKDGSRRLAKLLGEANASENAAEAIWSSISCL